MKVLSGYQMPRFGQTNESIYLAETLFSTRWSWAR
jgi:hypothetical protein